MADSTKKSTKVQGLIILAVIVVAAIGGYSVLSGKNAGDKPEAIEVSAGNASGTTAVAASDAQAVTTPGGLEIAPGNPIIAKVGDQAITRVDVFNFIQQLPENTRQMPLEQLFLIAQQQLINANVMNAQADTAKLDKNPDVIERLEIAKKQIVRNVYVQNAIDKVLTQDRVNKAYDEYVKAFPDVTEVKASHILVKDEALAKSLIAKLNDGADFAALAKESSTDATAQNGGDLGYFLQSDVVPTFGAAAFGLSVGEYTKTPVKSQFGFHIIKADDSRKRAAPELEEARPFIEAQLRRTLLNEIIIGWKEKTSIELFDINGNSIEPASGE